MVRVCVVSYLIKKGYFNEWRSTILPTSTKPTITFHLHTLNRKTISWHMQIQILDRDKHKHVAGLMRLNCPLSLFIYFFCNNWQLDILLPFSSHCNYIHLQPIILIYYSKLSDCTGIIEYQSDKHQYKKVKLQLAHCLPWQRYNV